MELPGRHCLCARCRKAVTICSHCDRGHRYCCDGCSQAARQCALRDAGQRYQATRQGRHRYAERQRRYRVRMAPQSLRLHKPIFLRYPVDTARGDGMHWTAGGWIFCAASMIFVTI